jgi:hypothetical protein
MSQNSFPESYPFTIKFRGIDELFTFELNDTLTTIRSLINKIQRLYQAKYAKQIKIDQIFHYDHYMSLACDILNYDDATRIYEWKELKDDDDVVSMFGVCLIDPKYPHNHRTTPHFFINHSQFQLFHPHSIYLVQVHARRRRRTRVSWNALYMFKLSQHLFRQMFGSQFTIP